VRVRGRKRAGLTAAALAAALAGLAPEVHAEPLRLVALGDSLTQGFGLPEAQGLVPQLQAWLSARGHDVRVINAGVSGDTTAGGLARLDWTLGDRPEAMIVALGGNDLLRGIDPRATRANLDAILTRLGAEGVPVLLAGLPAPANFGPDWQAAFAAIFPELAEAHGAILLPDLLAPVLAALQAGTRPADLVQPDGIHPSAAGVALIVEALGPEVERLIARMEGG
jgi:acyl-CoA thioesterase I